MIGPVKKQIFPEPDKMAYGWSATDWAKALRRSEMPVDVYLGTMKSDDPDNVRVQRLGASRS